MTRENIEVFPIKIQREMRLYVKLDTRSRVVSSSCNESFVGCGIRTPQGDSEMDALMSSP